MNETIRLDHYPERIVSLVPSQTELLYDLGLDQEVIGITRFCIHPRQWFLSKKRIGGTKDVKLEEVIALKPDLILGNKEENTLKDIVELRKIAPVYMSDIMLIDQALQMISDVGLLTNRQQKSAEMIQRIQTEFNSFPQLNGRVLYLIWAEPYMAAGENTFIGEMIRRAGFVNALEDPSLRYVSLSELELKSLNYDYILLSSEPFHFQANHWQELESISGKRIISVDGEMFSWYGSRMLKFPQYFSLLQEQMKGIRS